jgi:hypothetical protein
MVDADRPEVSSSQPCPVCRDPIDGGDVFTCGQCETTLHTNCKDYIGGCARYACVDAATPRHRLAEYLTSELNMRLMNSGAMCILMCVATLFAHGGNLRPRNPLYYYGLHPLFLPVWLSVFGYYFLQALRPRLRLVDQPSIAELRILYQRVRHDVVIVAPEFPGFFRWLFAPAFVIYGLVSCASGQWREGIGFSLAGAAIVLYFRFWDRLQTAAATSQRLHDLWASEFSSVGAEALDATKKTGK